MAVYAPGFAFHHIISPEYSQIKRFGEFWLKTDEK